MFINTLITQEPWHVLVYETLEGCFPLNAAFTLTCSRNIIVKCHFLCTLRHWCTVCFQTIFWPLTLISSQTIPVPYSATSFCRGASTCQRIGFVFTAISSDGKPRWGSNLMSLPAFYCNDATCNVPFGVFKAVKDATFVQKTNKHKK